MATCLAYIPRVNKLKRNRRRLSLRRRIRTGFAALGLGLAAGAGAQAVKPLPVLSRVDTSSAIDERWRETFDAFAAADKAHAPPPGGVLFVGSSSIRLWSDLETQFQTAPVIVKRGFGGSRLSDCTQNVARLVLPYKPRLVIVYAGDNDLAEGATPQDVLGSFTRFVEQVRAELPQTRIAYLSIKPSPLRQALMVKVAETNRLIAGYAEGAPNLDYIDIYSRMLDADGQPRPELFLPDRLHLNPTGYALWQGVIAPHLVLPPALATATATAAVVR